MGTTENNNLSDGLYIQEYEIYFGEAYDEEKEEDRVSLGLLNR